MSDTLRALDDWRWMDVSCDRIWSKKMSSVRVQDLLRNSVHSLIFMFYTQKSAASFSCNSSLNESSSAPHSPQQKLRLWAKCCHRPAFGSWKTLPSMLHAAVGEETTRTGELLKKLASCSAAQIELTCFHFSHSSHFFLCSSLTDSLWSQSIDHFHFFSQ